MTHLVWVIVWKWYDSSVLREISNKSVLNIGYANNGALLEYASLKEYIIPNIKNMLGFITKK